MPTNDEEWPVTNEIWGDGDEEPVSRGSLDHGEPPEAPTNGNGMKVIKPEPPKKLINPVPASGLGSGEPVQWIWHGYLGPGLKTLLVALWKSGKTTLIAHLLKQFEEGGELAGTVKKVKPLVITEEGQGTWARRRDDHTISDNAEFVCIPFVARPPLATWERAMSEIALLVKEKGYNVVIFDTIAAIIPCDNENDASKMGDSMMPMHQITEAGAAILMVHHPKKGDATEAQAARGSGALAGFVDIIMEMRRFAPEQREDRRRVIKAYGRYDDETPHELVIELRHEGGYRVIGSKADTSKIDRNKVINTLLADAPNGLDAKEAHSLWPDDCGVPKPGRGAIRTLLAQGATAGSWNVSGTGKKNDALIYTGLKTIHTSSIIDKADASVSKFLGYTG